MGKTLSIKDLSVLAYANNFTLWHYVSSTDKLDELLAPGYFNPATDMLRHGDMVILNPEDKLGCIYFVQRNDEGKIYLFKRD